MTSPPHSTIQIYFGPKASCTLSSSVPGPQTHYTARNLLHIDEDGCTSSGYHPQAVHGKKRPNVVYRAELYSADAGSDEMPVDAALRWATGMENIDGLLKEAHFYENELKELQGTVVPKFYGFFVGKVGDVDIGCTLVEWCGGVPHVDLWERNAQKILATARMHNKLVCHGRLGDDRHFVVSSKDNRMHIINFTHASIHKCSGGTPLLLNPDDSEDTPMRCSRCPELALVEETYGPDTGMDGYRLRQVNGLKYDGGFSSSTRDV